MPVFQLSNDIIFPPPHLAEDDGLLAVGGDLSPERILTAYSMGIFPWYSQGDPILWWSPAPRLILEPTQFKLSKKTAKLMRREIFKTTFDRAFSEVIKACSTEGNRKTKGTWITNDMIDAYIRLHELGAAHSVECWFDGELAGGLYGLSLGGIFFGESMFTRVDNASKIALATLIKQLIEWKFDLVDCQLASEHLIRLGAREISREEFASRIEKSIKKPSRLGSWNSKQKPNPT